MKQVTLSKKDIKKLNEEISTRYGVDDFFSKSDFITLVEDKFVVKEGQPFFFYKNDLLLPCLKLILNNNFLKNITIDMGAVPFAAKGADMMRPGIVGIDEGIEKGDVVAIVDERNQKPIAIGQSLFSAAEMQGMEAGKAVLNLHYVGDDVWDFSAGS